MGSTLTPRNILHMHNTQSLQSGVNKNYVPTASNSTSLMGYTCTNKLSWDGVDVGSTLTPRNILHMHNTQSLQSGVNKNYVPTASNSTSLMGYTCTNKLSWDGVDVGSTLTPRDILHMHNTESLQSGVNKN